MRRRHVDGYANSFLGRLLREREGAGQGAVCQFWAEVLWGDALDVQRNLPGMPLTCFDVLHLRYVFDPEFGLTANAKAALIDLPTRLYWVALERGELWLWSRLDRGAAAETGGTQPPPEPNLSVSVTHTHTASAGIAKPRELIFRSPKRTKPAHPDNVPELSLRALRRPMLTLPRR